MSHRLRPIVLLTLPLVPIAPPEAPGQSMEQVRVADDARSFVLDPSGKPFRPVGFNYDHDETMKEAEPTPAAASSLR